MMAWQGFALVLMGAFLISLYDITNKKLLVKKAPADCISTVTFLGSGALLLVASLVFNPPRIDNWFDFPQGFLWPLFAAGALNVIIMFGRVRALRYGDVSLITPLSATQPMVVLIPSWFILGEAPDIWGYIGLFLLAVGVYVFSFAEEVYVLNPKTGEKEPWQPPGHLAWMGSAVRYYAPVHQLFRNKGVRIALVVAVCGAVAINFDKLLILQSRSILFADAIVLLFIGVVGLVKKLVTNEWGKMTRAHLVSLIGSPIALAVVEGCYSAALLYGFASHVGALKRTSVIFILFLGWLLLNEQGVKKRWPGSLIMTAGAALLSL